MGDKNATCALTAAPPGPLIAAARSGTPPPLEVRTGILAFLCVSLLLLVAAIIWAAFARVDKVVTGRGKTVTDTPTVVLQPLSLSVIRELRVRVGDRVTAGQPLVILDPTFAEAELTSAQEREADLQAEVRRLRAQLGHEPYPRPPEPSQDDGLEEQMLIANEHEYLAQLENYDSQLAANAATLASLTSAVELYQERLGVGVEIEGMHAELIKRGQSSSKLQFLTARAARMEIDQSMRQARGDIAALHHKVAALKAERNGYTQKWIKDTQAELLKAEGDLGKVTQDLRKAQLANKLVVMVSPIDATVLELSKLSVGSVIREAETVVTLVPSAAKIEVETTVSGSDVAYLEAGQPVRIKLDALPFQKYGVLDGVLERITADAFVSETDGQPTDLNYRVRVAVTGSRLRGAPRSFNLFPGLPLTIEAKVGDRSVLEYFLWPILRGLDQSIREP